MNKKLFLLILGMALSLFVSCTIDYDKGNIEIYNSTYSELDDLLEMRIVSVSVFSELSGELVASTKEPIGPRERYYLSVEPGDYEVCIVVGWFVDDLMVALRPFSTAYKSGVHLERAGEFQTVCFDGNGVFVER